MLLNFKKKERILASIFVRTTYHLIHFILAAILLFIHVISVNDMGKTN
jgi:hypothetical protein